MNEIREYLKKELGVSDEHYDSMVKQAKETSMPNKNLENIGNTEAIQMQLIDNLGNMVSDLMQRVNELEGK